MAMDKNDAVIPRYSRGSTPPLNGSLPVYLQNELEKLQHSISAMRLMTPQVCDAEPSEKMNGMMRFAKSPWDPLGTGFVGWVYWDQATSTWKQL